MTDFSFENIEIFQKVKAINGHNAFKTIQTKSQQMIISKKGVIPELSIRKYYIYIISGQVIIWKRYSMQYAQDHNNNVKQTILKKYSNHDHFGFQDIELLWNQSILTQVSQGSVLIIIPLQQFYRCFRRVINLNWIKQRAEYFKKLQFFKPFKIDRIYEIASLCSKKSAEVGTVLYVEGELIQQFLVVLKGSISLTNSKGILMQYQSNHVLGSYEMYRMEVKYLFSAQCLSFCEIYSIPKQEVANNYNVHKKSCSEFVHSKDKFSKVQSPLFIRRANKTETQIRKKSYFQENINQIPSNLNNKKQIQSNHLNKRVKSAILTNTTKKISQIIKRSEQSGYKSKQSLLKSQGKQMELSQICWHKFINRKHQLKTQQILKYINSETPQLLFDSKQAFWNKIKTHQKKDNTFIKNYKRKLKKSLLQKKWRDENKNVSTSIFKDKVESNWVHIDN